MTTAFLDLVNHERQMRPEEVRGQIKEILWKDRKKRQTDKGRMRNNPLVICHQKKKKNRKKKVWHKKLLTATFYSAFGQRTEHLTKR